MKQQYLADLESEVDSLIEYFIMHLSSEEIAEVLKKKIHQLKKVTHFQNPVGQDIGQTRNDV